MRKSAPASSPRFQLGDEVGSGVLLLFPRPRAPAGSRMSKNPYGNRRGSHKATKATNVFHAMREEFMSMVQVDQTAFEISESHVVGRIRLNPSESNHFRRELRAVLLARDGKSQTRMAGKRRNGSGGPEWIRVNPGESNQLRRSLFARRTMSSLSWTSLQPLDKLWALSPSKRRLPRWDRCDEWD
jgi:hypothetical protein